MAIVKPLATALAGTYFIARYPRFDLEDPDWPDFRIKLAEVEKRSPSFKPDRRSRGGDLSL